MTAIPPGPTDVPGPGAPGSPPALPVPLPASAGVNNPDQLTPDELLSQFVGNYGLYDPNKPQAVLHSHSNNDPTDGHDSNSDSFIDSAFAFVGEILGVLVYPIKQVISWVWEGVKAAAQWAWNFASDVWNSAVDAISAVWDAAIQSLKDAFAFISDQAAQLWVWATTAFNWVVDKGAWVLGQLENLVSLVADAVASSLGWIWENLIQPVTDLIGSLFGTLWDAFWSAATWVWDKVQAIAEAVVNAVLDAASWVWDKVYAIAKAIVDAAIDALGFAWDVLQEAWKWIEYFATHPFSWFGDLLSAVENGETALFGPGIVAALHRESDAIEAVVASWLG